MWLIVFVWLVAVGAGAFLWTRFTRAPTTGTVRVPGQQFTPRRVVPVWLVLVLLILLVIALWLTVRWLPAQSPRL